MKNIKIRYTIRTESGIIIKKVFDIERLEGPDLLPWDGEVLHRDLLLGYDVDGTEVYEGDILQHLVGNQDSIHVAFAARYFTGINHRVIGNIRVNPELV